MDYARKIGKSTEPKKWEKQPPTVLYLSDGPLRPDNIFLEDRRLKNWNRWLSDRKQQYKYINSRTGRRQTDQIMNSCETVRPLVEMRNLIDYATVPVPIIPDKYRGGPEFWRTPPLIPKRDPCLPDIPFAPNKKQLNEDPELMYVGLPELIEQEKDLVGLASKRPLWKRSQYLMNRKIQLSKEIELLVPKEPETEQLIIKNHVPPKEPEFRRIPPITISKVEEEDEEKSCEYPEQVIILKIQDTEIVWSSQHDDSVKSEPITWHINFSSKVNQMVEKEIVLENKGNRVIIYQWRDARYRSQVMPLSRRISPFFFNKTKGVILPGQFVKLKIWYRSRSSGISVELWRLQTDPQLCSSPLIFRFWGCTATLKDTEGYVRMIDEYLDRCIRNDVIREIIEECVNSIRLEPDPAYGSMFLESEIFVTKNPVCFYHPSILVEFHKLYYNATNQKEYRWNLSINDLRDTLLMIKNLERRSFMLAQLNQLYKECLKPVLHKPVQCDKHEMVYNLLCTFVNQFEMESQNAKCICLEDNYNGVNTISKTSSISETSIKNKSRTKSSSSLQSGGAQGINMESSHVIDNLAYREIFFVCIYQLLGETLVKIAAVIETYNNLNERDK